MNKPLAYTLIMFVGGFGLFCMCMDALKRDFLRIVKESGVRATRLDGPH